MNIVIPIHTDPIQTALHCLQFGVMHYARAIQEADTHDRLIQIRRQIAARTAEMDALERLAFERMDAIDADPVVNQIVSKLKQLAAED